jgi:hypothetical protein
VRRPCPALSQGCGAAHGFSVGGRVRNWLMSDTLSSPATRPLELNSDRFFILHSPVGALESFLLGISDSGVVLVVMAMEIAGNFSSFSSVGSSIRPSAGIRVCF